MEYSDSTVKFLAVLISSIFVGLLGSYYYSLSVDVDFDIRGSNGAINCDRYDGSIVKVYNKFIDNSNYYIMTTRKELYEVTEEEYACKYTL